MAFAIRTATDYKDCLDQIRQFTQKAFKAGIITAGGGNTGDGTVYGASASENSVAETWTLTCTTGGTNEVAIFSVVGSVSGTQLTANAGVPYSIDKTSFVIIAGDTDFAVSDSFTFDVAASTPEWVQDRWDTSGEYELIQHGIGGGSDEIYIGVNTKSDGSTYWNFELSPFTGYIPSNTFDTQIGYMPEWVCANNTSFVFYVSFTSYRINMVLIPVEGSHEMGGLGWLNSYASPSQWSCPNFCGGSRSSASSTIGGSGGNFPTSSNLKVLDGSSIRTVTVSPVDYGQFSSWQSNPDGFIRLYPVVPIYSAEDTFLGEIDGIFWPTPYVPLGGLLTALAILVGQIEDFGGVTKDICSITFRNVAATAAGNISAFDLTGD